MSRTSYDTDPEEVINRAKFNVCMRSSFGACKTHRHTPGKNVAL